MSLCRRLVFDKVKLTATNQIPIICKRKGHTIRGKAPGVARTLEQRLNEENKTDPDLARKINIGFPKLRPARSVQLKERLAHVKLLRSNPELEKKARNGTLEIDLDVVKNDDRESAGQFQLKTIAEHYGVFQDLFRDAFFIPRVPLSIKYSIRDDAFCSVYNGNIIKPSEAAKEPLVSYDTSLDLITGKKTTENTLWTLILTNPDGHFSGTDKEYVHWFLSNIPGDKMKDADQIVPYIQPFPAKGLGFQRFVFVLYKQNKKIDFGSYKVDKLNDLNRRTFSTLNFYKKYQDEITPAGLAFFQSDWEKSITKFYHTVLDMKEPSFEYDFAAPYIRKQTWFPLRQPFNLYMDKYKDPRDVNKEYLIKKLAKTHPFNGPEPRLRFPNAHQLINIPSWLKTEIRKERLGVGRINDI